MSVSLAPLEPTCPDLYEDESQEGCCLTVFHFWYVNQIYKEKMKHIERKNGVKTVAQVKVTFETDGEDGSPRKALSEFANLVRSSLAEVKSSVIPLKFVDPDQWSDAVKVIRKNENKLLLLLSSEEVTIGGPSQSQEAFSATLNAMQKTNTSLQEYKLTPQDASLKTGTAIKHPSTGAGLTTRESCSTRTQCPENVKEGGQQQGGSKDETCPICMDLFTNKKQLKCKHAFCEECLQSAEKFSGPICPVCKDVFGVMIGDQPEGTMTWRRDAASLLGFEDCGHIEIAYNIPRGIQTKKHPNPGQPYNGTARTAYLPDNKEGNKVLQLLKKAFDQRLIFTVGTSITTGIENQVTWSDISHKTFILGGPACFGYPDLNYIEQVKRELKAKGVE
ncbi:E3 ubiquitin-protein ligase DTX3L-like [Cololabis saira]|uniref:E3 ubiquitin-protein ligase DTX3L-like n=1 Tax=Cololabis saira TaxID=129043 RepID=UPI002AD37A91|nr:E3 ubiquitin-protein ligase DTX3L-like [Cololabis saira]